MHHAMVQLHNVGDHARVQQDLIQTASVQLFLILYVVQMARLIPITVMQDASVFPLTARVNVPVKNPILEIVVVLRTMTQFVAQMAKLILTLATLVVNLFQWIAKENALARIVCVLKFLIHLVALMEKPMAINV